MKLWEIAKNVGSAIVRNTVPGGGILIDTVNEFLPDDKKLPKEATGNDIESAVQSLPAEQRAAVMEKEFDVQIEQIRQGNESLRAMLEADYKTPHTTRPYIAKGAFHVVAFAVVATVGAWVYGVLTADKEMVSQIMSGWQFILAVIGPLVVLLHAYFGVLRKEQQNRLNAANGKDNPAGIAGAIAGLIGRK